MENSVPGSTVEHAEARPGEGEGEHRAGAGQPSHVGYLPQLEGEMPV